MSRCGCVAVLVALMVGVPSGETAGKAGGGAFDRAAWETEVINRGLDPDEVVYPFDASPEMKEWAEEAVKTGVGFDPGQRLSRLQQAMFEIGIFDFAYDDTHTLTAEDAFSSRRGNCMSFTALFVAISRSVGISTFLMEIRREPEVGRDDGLVIINRHVVAGHRYGGKVSIYDFNFSSSAPFVSGLVIDDVHASAMYHANLGSAALRGDELDRALHHLEITTTLAPDWTVGWVNLGVALTHLGDVDGAFAAYERALKIDPTNSSALNNLSFLYSGMGRKAEAEIALQAAAKSTESPFTLLAMANLEMDRGDDREAAKYLKRAKREYPKEPEVYEAMARLETRMDRSRKAERYLRKAEALRAGAAVGR